MKRIVKRIPEHTVIQYQCEKCKTKYKNRSKALKCEEMPVEVQQLKVGDRVTWLEMRRCAHGKSYRLCGWVVALKGPELPDEEYNNKWLGGKLNGTHVYMYEVVWVCPHCKTHCSGKFYLPELKKL